jgi:hypothetical protein
MTDIRPLLAPDEAAKLTEDATRGWYYAIRGAYFRRSFID